MQNWLTFIVAEIVLFDLNRTVNEEIGRDIVDIYGLCMNKDHAREIAFKNVRLMKAYNL